MCASTRTSRRQNGKRQWGSLICNRFMIQIANQDEETWGSSCRTGMLFSGKIVTSCGDLHRRRGAMCSGTSDPNLSPTKWPLRQGQAMNFFNFYKLSEKISDFQSSFAVFTIFFFLENK